MTGELVLPDDTSGPPTVIQLSANTGPLEYDGTITDIAFTMNLGLQPMVYLINNDPSLLKNYELVIHETDCGFAKFEYNYFSNCMKRHYEWH